MKSFLKGSFLREAFRGCIRQLVGVTCAGLFLGSLGRMLLFFNYGFEFCTYQLLNLLRVEIGGTKQQIGGCVPQ
jgi:hypothetical protein